MRATTRIGLAALAVALAYAALGVHAGFLYDDRELILDERRPAGLSDVAAALGTPYYGALPYYRPVTRATYLLEKAIHGDSPRAFHLANATLAGALVIAAYALLRRPRFAIAPAPAVVAAALFALHPVASSCVLPIAGRDTLLPVTLMIVAVALWVTPGRLARAGAWTALAFALLSKEVAIATPLLFAIADATAEDRPRGATAWISRYAPVAAVAVAYLALRHAVLAGATRPLVAAGSPWLPVASLAYGLQSAFAPFGELVYQPSLTTWWSTPRLLLAGAALAGVVWAVRKLASAPSSRSFAFWTGWFVAIQLPAANLVKQETLFDERYAFPALLAPIALAATAASAPSLTRAWRAALGVIAAAGLIAAAATTVHRSTAFASEAAFQEQWVRTSPGSADAENGLGVVRVAEGRKDEAERAFRAALASRPEHPQALNNLGVLLLDRGDVAGASVALEAAVAGSPRYAAARYNLANALARGQRPAEAEASYLEAIRLRPAYVAAWNNLGALYVREGRSDEALQAFETVAKLDPGHARARVNRGILLARAGRYSEAIAAYRDALAIAPSDPDAHFDLGAAALASGDRATAEREIEEALRLRPGWADAKAALERLRAESGESGH